MSPILFISCSGLWSGVALIDSICVSVILAATNIFLLPIDVFTTKYRNSFSKSSPVIVLSWMLVPFVSIINNVSLRHLLSSVVPDSVFSPSTARVPICGMLIDSINWASICGCISCPSTNSSCEHPEKPAIAIRATRRLYVNLRCLIILFI